MAESLSGAYDLNDGSQFDAFYRSNYDRTVRLVRLLSGSQAPAEDIAQEAFAAVFRHRSRVENPLAFLRVTTVNLCRNLHRGRSREARRLERLDPPGHLALSPESSELAPLVAQLGYRQRAVLVMRYWLDMSEADIAGALKCRPGTVKSLHARAMAHLREGLERDEQRS